MKQWRSKYGRIPESKIIQFITEDGTIDTCKYFLVRAILCTVEGNKIYWEIIDDDNLYESIMQYMKLKGINIFNSFEELEKYLEIEHK